MLRNTFSTPLLVTGLLLLGIVGCIRPSDNADGEVLARVGSATLTLQQARQQIPDFVFARDSVSALRSFREDWIERQLLIQEAERSDLNHRNDVAGRIARAREDVLVQALKDNVLGGYEEQIEVTKEEARQYYEENKEQFVLDERYIRFRHLVTADLGDSRSAKRDLLRGKTWREVVQKYALDKEETLENSTRFYPQSAALKNYGPMHQYLKVIGIGEVSPIRLIDGQYHFVQLVEQRAEGEHPDLEWLLGRIQDWLRLEKRRKRFNGYVKNLYLRANSNNEIITYDVLPQQTSKPDTTAAN